MLSFFYKENCHKFVLKVADESWTESMQFHKISYSRLFFLQDLNYSQHFSI